MPNSIEDLLGFYDGRYTPEPQRDMINPPAPGSFEDRLGFYVPENIAPPVSHDALRPNQMEMQFAEDPLRFFPKDTAPGLSIGGGGAVVGGAGNKFFGGGLTATGTVATPIPNTSFSAGINTEGFAGYYNDRLSQRQNVSKAKADPFIMLRYLKEF